MTEHHKDASVGVAQAVFDRMAPDEQAEVLKEARENGVDPLEIVRSALDVLIDQSGRAAEPKVAGEPDR